LRTDSGDVGYARAAADRLDRGAGGRALCCPTASGRDRRRRRGRPARRRRPRLQRGGLTAMPVPSLEAADRRLRALRLAMGPVLAAALADPKVVEVMVNPDGG